MVQRLGHVIEDIRSLIFGLNWADASWVKRSAKSIAHSLACYLKNVSEDIVWIKDSPPPALEALYHDSLPFQ